MKHLNTPRLALPALALTLVAGVATTTGCRYSPDSARVDRVSESEYPQVTVNGSLRTRIVASAPSVRLDPGVPMSVSVPIRYIPLRRLSSEGRAVQYRFLFFANDGRPLDNNPAWKYMDVPARTQVFLTGSAMDLGAVDWRCEIRPNDVED